MGSVQGGISLSSCFLGMIRKPLNVPMKQNRILNRIQSKTESEKLERLHLGELNEGLSIVELSMGLA